MQKRIENVDEVIKLRKEKKTYREIAQIFGVSYQRIHQIISQKSPELRRMFRNVDTQEVNRENA